MKTITERQRRAADLVVNGGRTMACVGREFGVTAATVRRWVDAVYPPPPTQYMTTMHGYFERITNSHAHGVVVPQKYDDLNRQQRRDLREQYVEHTKGRCLYCYERLDDEPHKFVCQSAGEIVWDDLPGGKEGFLRNPVHLHHDRETGLTLAAVHALCNAHSWQFYEVPALMEKFVEKIKGMSGEERDELVARVRKRWS